MAQNGVEQKFANDLSHMQYLALDSFLKREGTLVLINTNEGRAKGEKGSYAGEGYHSYLISENKAYHFNGSTVLITMYREGESKIGVVSRTKKESQHVLEEILKKTILKPM